MNYSPEILLCSICNLPINLELDRSADETGKPVHEICYLRKLVPITQETAGRFTQLLRKTLNRAS